MKLTHFQSAHREWSYRNFGETTELKIFHVLTGITEELGELCAEVKLLRHQTTRQAAIRKNIEDAIGDTLIYATDLCSRSDWQLRDIVGSESFEELQLAAKNPGEQGQALLCGRSRVLRYTEEALAEGYAIFRRTGSLQKAIGFGAKFPIRRDYVTLSGLVAEAGAGGTVFVIVVYGAHEAGEALTE